MFCAMLTKFHCITNLKKCLQVGFWTFYRASESSPFNRSPWCVWAFVCVCEGVGDAGCVGVGVGVKEQICHRALESLILQALHAQARGSVHAFLYVLF
jgi:hypothetical protein